MKNIHHNMLSYYKSLLIAVQWYQGITPVLNWWYQGITPVLNWWYQGITPVLNCSNTLWQQFSLCYTYIAL